MALLKRVLRKLPWVALYGLIAVLMGVGALLLSLKTAWVQQHVASIANSQLNGIFRGQVHLKLNGSLSLWGIDGVALEVRRTQASDTPLLEVSNLAATWNVQALAASALGSGPLIVEVTRLTADRIRVDLQTDAENGLELLNALSASASPAEPKAAAANPALLLRLVDIDVLQADVLLPGSGPPPPSDSPSARQVVHLHKTHGSLTLFDELLLRASVGELRTALPAGDAEASAEVQAWLFVDKSATASATVSTQGSLGQLQFDASAKYHADQYSAEAALKGDPEQWASVHLGWAPARPLAVRVQATGNARQVDVIAETQDSNSLRVDARMNLSPLSARGRLITSNASPGHFYAGAPEGSVNSALNFDFVAEPLRVSAEATIRSSTINGAAVPDLDLKGTFTEPRTVHFELKSLDPSQIQMWGKLDASSSGTSFDVHCRGDRLSSFALMPDVNGLGVRDFSIDASGRLAPDSAALQATVGLRVARASIPQASATVSNLSSDLTISGTLREPDVSGVVTLGRLTSPTFRASAVAVKATPSRSGASVVSAKATVHLGPKAPARALSAQATLLSLDPPEIADVQLSLSGSGRVLTASAARVFTQPGVHIRALRVSGVGQLSADISLNSGAVDLHARTENFDLAAVSELLAPLTPPLSGVLNVDASLELAGRDLTSGHLYAKATGVAMGASRVEQLGASMVVLDGQISGTVEARRGGSMLRADLRNLDLRPLLKLGQTPGASSLTPADLRGYAVVTAFAHLADFPELEAAAPNLHAQGLVQASLFAQQEEGLPLTLSTILSLTDVELRQLPAANAQHPNLDAASTDGWVVRDVEAEWASRYSAKTGQWSNSVLIRGNNDRAPVASLTLASQLSLEQLTNIGREFRNTPLSATFTLPRTPLQALPLSSFLPGGIEAEVAADIRFTGSLNEPEASGSLELANVQVGAYEKSLPVTVTVTGKLQHGDISAEAAVVHESAPVAHVTVTGSAPTGAWLVDGQITSMPLGCLPYVRDYGAVGRVSGKLRFDTRGPSPSLGAQIKAEDVEAYGQKMPKVVLTVDLQRGAGRVQADLQQAQGRARLDLEALSNTEQLPDYKPTRVHFDAKSFQLRPLLALVQGTLSDLSGELNGALDVGFGADGAEATGALELRDGMVFLPAFGKEIRSIGFTATARPGQLWLSDVRAQVEDGKLTGVGHVKYNNHGEFEAVAQLKLPESAPLPISHEGRDIARASGEFELKATRDKDSALALSVGIPRLDVYFADSAQDDVVSPKPPDFVSLGYRTSDGHFVGFETAGGSPSQPGTATEVTVQLGRDVWLHQGRSTFAAVEGKVSAELGDETRIRGALNLREGRIEVQGKVFDVRPGTVTFRGASPPNPDIVAEAAWTSPSGYTIIAGFRGAANNGEVTLHSEPPLSYGEILNVLLFDDPVGESDSESSPGASAVASTLAGAGLSRSLSDLVNLDIQANIATTENGATRPEVGIRLSPRLAVQVAYNVEAATSLSEPPDNAFVSFDWRLSSSWTIESTFGDQGSTSADVAWKFRY